ncbi:unnamed protein product [Ixodes persulcatus]
MSVRVCASCFLKLARTERINNPGYKWIIFARGAKGLFGMFIEAWIGWRMSHLQLDHTTCITFSVGTSRAFCRNRVSTGEPSQFCRTRISTGLASPGLLVKF